MAKKLSIQTHVEKTRELCEQLEQKNIRIKELEAENTQLRNSIDLWLEDVDDQNVLNDNVRLRDVVKRLEAERDEYKSKWCFAIHDLRNAEHDFVSAKELAGLYKTDLATAKELLRDGLNVECQLCELLVSKKWQASVCIQQTGAYSWNTEVTTFLTQKGVE